LKHNLQRSILRTSLGLRRQMKSNAGLKEIPRPLLRTELDPRSSRIWWRSPRACAGSRQLRDFSQQAPRRGLSRRIFRLRSNNNEAEPRLERGVKTFKRSIGHLPDRLPKRVDRPFLREHLRLLGRELESAPHHLRQLLRGGAVTTRARLQHGQARFSRFVSSTKYFAGSTSNCSLSSL
jgi:hypothetical protein